MIRILSGMTSVLYRRLMKPVLFRFAPDNVHTRMLRGGAILQRSLLFRRLLHAAWAYDNIPALSQTLHDITFTNPVGLSAGFDKNFELAPILKAIGFGFMEGGSLTHQPCPGNPRPWFYRLPNTKSIVVYAGLGNQGVKAILQRIRHYPPATFRGFPLNISVAKTNSPEACTDDQAIADYIASLQLIKQAGVGRMITLNISCPNTYGGEPFTTPDRLEWLLSEVDKVHLTQPVFIKMPAHLPWPAFAGLLKVTARHQVAGVTISNLAKDRGQAQLMDPLPDSVKGNLSGKPTWELSNNLIRETYRHYGDRFTIIGVGGIFSAEDAYTKIKLGASLVELVTGLIFEGPQLIGQINEGLVRLLQADGYTHIDQAIGADVER